MVCVLLTPYSLSLASILCSAFAGMIPRAIVDINLSIETKVSDLSIFYPNDKPTQEISP